jgi:putative solute:sodium symporter small subunit
MSSAASYWRGNVRRILRLLAVWLALTAAPALVTGWLAFDFIGWPMPYWLAAYGAPLAYLIIIGVYARAMARADAALVFPSPSRGGQGGDGVPAHHHPTPSPPNPPLEGEG